MQKFSKRFTRVSKWVELVETQVEQGNESNEIYHSLRLGDYVSVLAVTKDGRVPFVKQFRPARGELVLELPGGLLEEGELPETTAIRELAEEVGLRSGSKPKLLGKLIPDSGRLENNLWCYWIENAEEIPFWNSEQGVERSFVALKELNQILQTGTLSHALHVAHIGLARAFSLI